MIFKSVPMGGILCVCCDAGLLEWQHLDEAEESYVKALQLDPNYKDAEEELFKIRLEQLNVCLYVQF